MQKEQTIYHLIVDKSGSMSDCIEQTIAGFNEQVNKVQELDSKYPEQEISIGLTTFNHGVYHHFFQSHPSMVRRLNVESYRPEGSTALYDAIGLSVNQIEHDINHLQLESKPTVVIVILTDGHENASQSFDINWVKKTISRLEETGKWTFSFIGATLDAVDVAASMSIKSQNSFMFEKSNMRSGVFSKLSNSMDMYMNKKSRGKDLGNLFSEE